MNGGLAQGAALRFGRVTVAPTSTQRLVLRQDLDLREKSIFCFLGGLECGGSPQRPFPRHLRFRSVGKLGTPAPSRAMQGQPAALRAAD